MGWFWPITYPPDYTPCGTWFEENFVFDFDEFDGNGGAERAYPEHFPGGWVEPPPGE